MEPENTARLLHRQSVLPSEALAELPPAPAYLGRNLTDADVAGRLDDMVPRVRQRSLRRRDLTGTPAQDVIEEVKPRRPAGGDHHALDQLVHIRPKEVLESNDKRPKVSCRETEQRASTGRRKVDLDAVHRAIVMDDGWLGVQPSHQCDEILRRLVWIEYRIDAGRRP